MASCVSCRARFQQDCITQSGLAGARLGGDNPTSSLALTRLCTSQPVVACTDGPAYGCCSRRAPTRTRRTTKATRRRVPPRGALRSERARGCISITGPFRMPSHGRFFRPPNRSRRLAADRSASRAGAHPRPPPPAPHRARRDARRRAPRADGAARRATLFCALVRGEPPPRAAHGPARAAAAAAGSPAHACRCVRSLRADVRAGGDGVGCGQGEAHARAAGALDGAACERVRARRGARRARCTEPRRRGWRRPSAGRRWGTRQRGGARPHHREDHRAGAHGPEGAHARARTR